MEKNLQLPRVAIISSLVGGLGHYCAHLAYPLSNKCYIKYITYPQLDLVGTTVKQLTDSFIRKHIKWPRFDIDESNSLSIVEINDYLTSKNINIVNIHVATTVKKKITYFTTLLLYLKKLNNKKIVFTLHDVLPFEENNKLVKLLKVFYGLADFFTVGNEFEKTKLMRYFGVPESRISIVPHGIYNLFNRNLYTPAMAKNYLDLANNKTVILFFGFLREYKGFEYLIKAAKQIEKSNPNFIIYVASALKYASRELVEKYLELIRKLDLQEKFVLNLNYLDSLDIEAIFKASDIVALPYISSSQSGVEMLSFGFKKPVIITDAFYDKTWIDNKAGFVSKTKDPIDLSKNILKLMNDSKKAKSFGEYGYDYSTKNFSWDKIAEKYFSIYKKVLKM